MDPQRAMEIQQALVRAHYLNESPNGQWDAETQAAMVKYQTDNGWQSKITPDSRALIKLGLGPKQDAGEYAAPPAGISEISAPPAKAPTDTIRTLATTEIPMTASN
jgi:Putative peptidoglycan binding domain